VLVLDMGVDPACVELSSLGELSCAPSSLALPDPLAQLGSTAIGIATTEGVVLVVEKRLTSPLLVSGSIRCAS
jgi:20S proteasome alpha/beta subunit